ncbi:MAG: hypothetical protein ACF8QF_09510 [Phycisphaerales bacterium]
MHRAACQLLLALSLAAHGVASAAPPVPDAAHAETPWTVDRLVSRWIDAPDDAARRAVLADIERAGPLGAHAVLRLLPRAQSTSLEQRQDLRRTVAALSVHLAPLVIESLATEELHQRQPHLALPSLAPEHFANVLNAARAGTSDAFRRTAFALQAMPRVPEMNAELTVLAQAFALECLDSDDPRVRRSGFDGLGPDAFERLWFDLAQDPDPEIAAKALVGLTTLQAVRAMGGLGVDLRLPAILPLMRDSDPRIESGAWNLAWRLGRNANLHQAAWEAYTSTADDRLRRQMLRVCMSSRSTREQLVRILRAVRPDELESELIIEWLQVINIDAEILALALPHLGHARVSEVRPDWNYEVATNLGRDAVPALKSAIRDADPPTAMWAAAAMALVAIDFGAIDEESGAALADRIPEWVRTQEPMLLAHPDRPFVALAFLAPERNVPLSEWAIARAHDASDPHARTFAASAMLAMVVTGTISDEGARLLLEQLAGGPVQEEAIQTVARARVDFRPFVESLLALAEQRERQGIRRQAIDALAASAPADEATLDRLLALVSESQEDERAPVFHAVFSIVNRHLALQSHLLRRWAEQPELLADFVEHMATTEFGVIAIAPSLYESAFPTLLDRAAGLGVRADDPVWSALRRAAIYHPRLVELLEQQIRTEPRAASNAISTLQALRPITADAMNVVVRALAIDGAQVWATRALPEFGPISVDALPALQRLAVSADPRISGYAREAMEKIRTAQEAGPRNVRQ